VVPEVFNSVNTHVRHQHAIAVLASPVVTGQLIYNNTDKGIAMEVDPGGSPAYGQFKMLLENVFKAVGAIEERVVGEIYRRSGPGSNIFSLISKAPGAAKS